MRRIYPAIVVAAALLGFIAGYAAKPSPQAILSGHFDDLSMIPSASAQETKQEVMPFGFNSPNDPALCRLRADLGL